MKKYGVVFILVSLFILLILPKLIFSDSTDVDSTGIVNAIRFSTLSLIIAAIGIKLVFNDNKK
ncbi:hypothetical protein BAU15_08235 [Enterococcus sp. JM4C]|uniref:hypothetical protein n=1 Tax=Candidatus Enterococcus huntleyi TaxID=1857217 RepID=UPI001379E1A5|nr:hypothetical protein [Enterococcus sp. JM4C]KAF1297883.1 hypothetical protein BAU15_08235 [Enterococcus sp. JM4C]